MAQLKYLLENEYFPLSATSSEEAFEKNNNT